MARSAGPMRSNPTVARCWPAPDPTGDTAPADVRTAYGIPTTVNGKGETLALFELDGYVASDIAAYQKQFSLTAVPLQNVLVDSAKGISRERCRRGDPRHRAHERDRAGSQQDHG